MMINADFAHAVMLNTDEMPWRPSPMPGVERRMLYREGDEVAKATSLVRFSAGHHFSTHQHGGGEEFLVLDGVFSDEHGNFPVGSYVRNPVGTGHTPFSDQGCTILVRLWQMQEGDDLSVAVNTRSTDRWESTDSEDVEQLKLHHFQDEDNLMLYWLRASEWQFPCMAQYFELFVIEGELTLNSASFARTHQLLAGYWFRRPFPSHGLMMSATEGTRVLVRTW
jgi:hypothetical protein